MATWQPWNGMEELRREIDRAFENFGFSTEPFARTAFLPGRGSRRYPMINMYEESETLYVEALAPGVDPATLEVSVMGNTLTISGDKPRLAGDIKPEAYHRSERSIGKFIRTVELPVDIAADQVRADYRNGLIMVTLPKAAQARPKQIDVKVA